MDDDRLDLATCPLPVLAAAARVGHPLPASVAARLRRLEADGLQVTVAQAHDRALLETAHDVAAHPESDTPPPVLSTPKQRKALVAALAACRAADGSLYPGRAAHVEQVIALTSPASAHAARHIRGALDDLVALGLLDVAGDTVAPGPALAAWTARWHQQDLPEVLDRLDDKDAP